MKDNKRVLALIPARGGSKGLLRKNVQVLRGKPLIAWTIEEAQKSCYVDRVVVSTDDHEIAAIAKKYKAEVPFLRPTKLARDKAKTTAVALHALRWLKSKQDVYSILVLLQPTSPLKLAVDIDNAVDLLSKKKTQAVVSVCEVEHHPFWSNVLPANGSMKKFLKKENINLNRQALPQYYRLNGAIYVAYVDYLMKNGSFFGENTYAYVMPTERSVDIDHQLDLDWAEFLLAGRGIK